MRTPQALLAVLALAAAGCVRPGAGVAGLPLARLADVDLPGAASRFDYQALDAAHGHLLVAHMGDSEVLVVDLADGSTVKRLPRVPTVRGVLASSDGSRLLATAAGSDELVVWDAVTLVELGRAATGAGPDGLAWDPAHGGVAVSDQGDGALSLLADGGLGARRQVHVGVEAGNVEFDAARGVFWVTAPQASPPDQLVAVDPVAGQAGVRVALPGCAGAHGLRLHPDGHSALVACEGNDRLARVDLEGAHAVVTAAVGAGPDVLAVDAAKGWLYVASESGDLTVFDLQQRGLVAIDREHPGDEAHSVAVDPATHRVFFPLVHGASGGPVLRIMRPGPP